MRTRRDRLRGALIEAARSEAQVKLITKRGELTGAVTDVRRDASLANRHGLDPMAVTVTGSQQTVQLQLNEIFDVQRAG